MNEKTQKNKIPFWRNIKVVPYLYILPNMILFLVFMIIPIFMSFYYGTVKWNGKTEIHRSCQLYLHIPG